MKQILMLLLLVFTTTTFSQQKRDTIHSTKLNQDREITISLPASYDKNATKKYPILLLLDGDYLMSPFQGALNFGAYWDEIPEIIIVGIHQNKKKERTADCEIDEITGLPHGKGIPFFEFISQEVLPYIESKYRISDFKMIAGHDITAGYLNFFLYKELPIFDAYISLSPELPAEMEEKIPERLSQIKTPIFYYQSTGDGDLKTMKDRIYQLDQQAKEIKNSTLNYGFDDFEGASHYSLVLQSIPNVLQQFFSIYRPITMLEYREKIAPLKEGYVTYLINKYEKIETILGTKMTIRVNDFKAIEAAILQNKDYNAFDELAILADKNYPKTMLGDYELGLMFEKKGDNPRAVRYYMSGFLKNEIGDLTKNMLFEKAETLKKTYAKKGKKEILEEPLIKESVEQKKQ
jgi:predicted alpha/beta superfamily hydrolase